MTEYRPSKVKFTISMFIGLMMLCPTFGLWIFVMMLQIWNFFSRSLIVEENQIVLRNGIINIKRQELPYNRINAVEVDQGLIGRGLYYGTLRIHVGNDITSIQFKDIDNPYDIKRVLNEKMARPVEVIVKGQSSGA